MGLKAVAKVGDWTTPPDLLNVFRRSDTIPALVDEILALPPEKRPKAVWLQSGITHPESEARLERSGMKVVSDRCLGVYAARVKK
jgi:predicted CoA-binding protein